ncbi:hypothetical protein F2P81_012002 [Scophthalmus maximus]|uniref:Uncharacterized protein n=1 Tax=Scophthalmus maximus TaxID=52904 RepID=A0A6A4SXW6_SCOMX|nr:hypothetical protein F2P81_012002 [Scophthalmus maximus]
MSVQLNCEYKQNNDGHNRVTFFCTWRIVDDLQGRRLRAESEHETRTQRGLFLLSTSVVFGWSESSHCQIGMRGSAAAAEKTLTEPPSRGKTHDNRTEVLSYWYKY